MHQSDQSLHKRDVRSVKLKMMKLNLLSITVKTLYLRTLYFRLLLEQVKNITKPIWREPEVPLLPLWVRYMSDPRHFNEHVNYKIGYFV